MLSSKTEELQGLQEISFDRQELKSCTLKYAKIAAIGPLLFSWIPGPGSGIAGVIQFVAIWVMYCQIATISGINKGFKFILAGIIANSLSVVLLIIPIALIVFCLDATGVGIIGGVLLDGLCSFLTLLLAARIFKTVFTTILKGKRASQA